MAAIDLLEPVNLAGLFERFAAEEQQPLAQFFPPMPNPVAGPTISYDIVEYARDIAQFNTRDGSPTPVAQPVRATVTYRAPSICEQVTIPAHTLTNLRAPGETAQRNGESWVARNVQNLTRRLTRRIEVLRAQALGLNPANPGYLQFRLPGLAADTLVDLGYAPTHLSLHNSDWSAADADIIGDIEAGIGRIAEDSGKVADTLIVGSGVMAMLRQNDAVMNLVTDAERAQLLLGRGLLRIAETTIQVVRGVYDNGGVLTPYVPVNGVVLLASDNADRMLLECSPTSIHAPDGARGLFVWRTEGTGIRDGVTVEYEWTGCPIVAQPAEIIADVDVTS